MVKAQCELVANGLQPSPGFVIGVPRWWQALQSEAPSAA